MIEVSFGEHNESIFFPEVLACTVSSHFRDLCASSVQRQFTAFEIFWPLLADSVNLPPVKLLFFSFVKWLYTSELPRQLEKKCNVYRFRSKCNCNVLHPYNLWILGDALGVPKLQNAALYLLQAQMASNGASPYDVFPTWTGIKDACESGWYEIECCRDTLYPNSLTHLRSFSISLLLPWIYMYYDTNDPETGGNETREGRHPSVYEESGELWGLLQHMMKDMTALEGLIVVYVRDCLERYEKRSFSRLSQTLINSIRTVFLDRNGKEIFMMCDTMLAIPEDPRALAVPPTYSMYGYIP